MITSAALLSQRLQHHRSIRWQADCGAQGRQARAPQPARQLLFSPQPADTVSDKAGRRPEAELAVDREAVSAYLDFLMAAVIGLEAISPEALGSGTSHNGAIIQSVPAAAGCSLGAGGELEHGFAHPLGRARTGPAAVPV